MGQQKCSERTKVVAEQEIRETLSTNRVVFETDKLEFGDIAAECQSLACWSSKVVVVEVKLF